MNKFKSAFFGLVVTGLISISSACSSQQLPIKMIYTSNQCNINTQLLQKATSQQQLEKQLKMGSDAGFQAALPALDFDTNSYILFALGQKPSSGYGIQLDQKIAQVKDQKLHFPVSILQPASGSMQAQVITSPCQVYSIPKTEFSAVVQMMKKIKGQPK